MLSNLQYSIVIIFCYHQGRKPEKKIQSIISPFTVADAASILTMWKFQFLPNFVDNFADFSSISLPYFPILCKLDNLTVKSQLSQHLYLPLINSCQFSSVLFHIISSSSVSVKHATNITFMTLETWLTNKIQDQNTLQVEKKSQRTNHVYKAGGMSDHIDHDNDFSVMAFSSRLIDPMILIL